MTKTAILLILIGNKIASMTIEWIYRSSNWIMSWITQQNPLEMTTFYDNKKSGGRHSRTEKICRKWNSNTMILRFISLQGTSLDFKNQMFCQTALTIIKINQETDTTHYRKYHREKFLALGAPIKFIWRAKSSLLSLRWTNFWNIYISWSSYEFINDNQRCLKALLAFRDSRLT